MPASSFNLYLQDARNNFDAVRPAPICTDANQTIGHYKNVHISTNCYYGYQDLKPSEKNHVDADCEMLETEVPMVDEVFPQPPSRKRNADSRDYPQSKRLRADDSPACSLVGTRSSPSHSASAFNVNIAILYATYLIYRFLLRIHVLL